MKDILENIRAGSFKGERSCVLLLYDIFSNMFLFQIEHVPLQNSVVLLLNIMYQSEKLEKVALSRKAIKSLAESSKWFVPAMTKFLSSGIHANIFYLLLIRDGLRFISDSDEEKEIVLRSTRKLINKCQVDDTCAKKMIRLVKKISPNYFSIVVSIQMYIVYFL